MKCPYCGGEEGYYEIEKVHRALFLPGMENRMVVQRTLPNGKAKGNIA